jgi:hypothetical protein
VGTRYEDQPVEQWAGAESLDPTPVWKQYILVAAFVLGALVLVAVVAYSALAVELATPPATLIGGRVVLAASEMPPVGAPPRRFGPPPSRVDGAFYLIQPERGSVIAIKENWRPEGHSFSCVIEPEDPLLAPLDRNATFSLGGCDFGGLGAGVQPSNWDAEGNPLRGTDQPLDRYLVSVEGSKVVVNTSRVINGVRKVPAPSDPTFQ